MPTLEALRLARAKALRRFFAHFLGNLPDEIAHEAALAIEAADAEQGVVSVPREATDRMALHAWKTRPFAQYNFTQTDRLTDHTAMRDIWNAAIAASPLREKSDG